MKKYIVFLFIFGLFFLGAGSAKAVSMSDLQNEIKSLSEQIVGLKSQLLGLVVNSRTAVVAPAPMAEVSTAPVLTVGTKSTEVAQVQTALKEQGYNIATDGSFGAKTEAAVRAFQIAKSLPVTGKVDSVTRDKLVSVVDNSAQVCVGSNIKIETIEKLRKLNLVENVLGKTIYLKDGVTYKINGQDATLSLIERGVLKSNETVTCGCPHSCGGKCEITWTTGSQQLSCTGSCNIGSFCNQACTWEFHINGDPNPKKSTQ